MPWRSIIHSKVSRIFRAECLPDALLQCCAAFSSAQPVVSAGQWLQLLIPYPLWMASDAVGLLYSEDCLCALLFHESGGRFWSFILCIPVKGLVIIGAFVRIRICIVNSTSCPEMQLLSFPTLCIFKGLVYKNLPP